MEAVDCQPDFCLDLFEPSGHGRRRRTLNFIPNKNATASAIDYTKFKENIEYTVLLPGEFDHLKGFQDPDQCKNFVLISGFLALLLTFSTILVITIFMYLERKKSKNQLSTNLHNIVITVNLMPNK